MSEPRNVLVTGGNRGIGLAIAKELLERQKALLTAGNAPEGGGRFEVRFYG